MVAIVVSLPVRFVRVPLYQFSIPMFFFFFYGAGLWAVSMPMLTVSTHGSLRFCSRVQPISFSSRTDWLMFNFYFYFLYYIFSWNWNQSSQWSKISITMDDARLLLFSFSGSLCYLDPSSSIGTQSHYKVKYFWNSIRTEFFCHCCVSFSSFFSFSFW